MTSIELNDIFNKTRRTPNISLTPKQVEDIIKDLEVLDILKRHYRLFKRFTEPFLVLKSHLLVRSTQK